MPGLLPLALWVATAAGQDDRLLRLPGGIPDVAVFALAQDAAGWIWISSVIGVYRYDGRQSVRWGGPTFQGESYEILQVEGDAVMVLGTDGRIRVLTPAHHQEITGPDGDLLGPVRHAVASPEGLWVLKTPEVGPALLWRRDPAGAWHPVPLPVSPRLLEASADGVWLLCREEIVQIQADGHTLERHSIPHVVDVSSVGAQRWAAAKDGRIWRFGPRTGGEQVVYHGDGWGESVIATETGAWAATTSEILSFEGAHLHTRIPVPAGVTQHDALLLDRDQDLWIATLEGARYRPSPETRILETPGQAARGLTGVGRVGDALWITGWVLSGHVTADQTYVPSGYLNLTWPFCAGPETAWSTGLRPQASEIDLVELTNTGTVVHARLPPAVWPRGCAVGTGGVWLATSAGLWRFAGEGPPIPVESPLPAAEFVALGEDGRLHAFGSERECHAQVDQILAPQTDTPVPWQCGDPWDGRPPLFAREVNGQIWAAGNGTGVLVETPEGWQRHVSSADLDSPTVGALVPSPHEGLWVVSLGSVLRVSTSKNPKNPWTILERLGSPQGIPDAGAWDLHEDPSGDVWLATDRGLVHVPPRARIPPPLPPAPQITGLWVDGEPNRQIATWPHNQIEIHGAVATYRERDRLLWRPRFGTARAPLSAAADPVLRLLDLPAGTHHISLEVSLDGRHWSPPSDPVILSVPLPIYLRPPALIAAVLSLLGAAFGLHRARLAALTRIERERTRIAMDLHDDLGAGLSTITMLTGLAADPTLQNDARQEVAGQAAEIAATLADSLADIVWALRRDAGRPEALARSLVERGRRLFASGNPRFIVEIADEWPDVTLPLAFFRSVQLIGYEALQNVARHADAQTVTLRFSPWTLEISDDGRGIHQPSPRAGTGTGLHAMRERARSIGARLDILDRPGGGTRLRLRLSPPRVYKWHL